MECARDALFGLRCVHPRARPACNEVVDFDHAHALHTFASDPGPDNRGHLATVAVLWLVVQQTALDTAVGEGLYGDVSVRANHKIDVHLRLVQHHWRDVWLWRESGLIGSIKDRSSDSSPIKYLSSDSSSLVQARQFGSSSLVQARSLLCLVCST